VPRPGSGRDAETMVGPANSDTYEDRR
jgi:hypothetical protein